MFNAFMYENLKPLAELSAGTTLCLFEPKRKLYIVKKADESCKKYYEAISSAKSPHLARILYLRCEEGALYTVREYVSGDSLADILCGGKTLPEDDAAKIVDQICDGLSELHGFGLVHRDVNPNNVLITTDGNAVIIDYGIVRSFDRAKSADTVILGTPGYAAPEQFGFSQSDQRTDIYAVGVLLNVMLTGKLPNEQLCRGDYCDVVKKCIHIDSERRYASVDELRNAVSEIAARRAPKECSASVSPADRFISNIPGIRSKNPLKVLLCAAGYLAIFAFMCLDLFTTKPTLAGYLSYALYWCLLAVIPLFCFGNMGGVWDKLPFTRGASKKSKYVIYFTLGIISLLLGFIAFALSDHSA